MKNVDAKHKQSEPPAHSLPLVHQVYSAPGAIKRLAAHLKKHVDKFALTLERYVKELIKN